MRTTALLLTALLTACATPDGRQTSVVRYSVVTVTAPMLDSAPVGPQTVVACSQADTAVRQFETGQPQDGCHTFAEPANTTVFRRRDGYDILVFTGPDGFPWYMIDRVYADYYYNTPPGITWTQAMRHCRRLFGKNDHLVLECLKAYQPGY